MIYNTNMFDIKGLKRQLLPCGAPSETQGIPAAVLVVLSGSEACPCLVFTRRSMQVATHKGQICFPGGVAEPGDGGPAATAIREAGEEIGLCASLVKVMGYLPNVCTVSRFCVTPVVVRAEESLSFCIAEAEVAEVFELPLSLLAHPRHRKVGTRVYENRRYEDFRFYTPRGTIWGATGRIVASLLDRLFSHAKME